VYAIHVLCLTQQSTEQTSRTRHAFPAAHQGGRVEQILVRLPYLGLACTGIAYVLVGAQGIYMCTPIAFDPRPWAAVHPSQVATMGQGHGHG